jgi:hypothetical protein
MRMKFCPSITFSKGRGDIMLLLGNIAESD